MTIRNDLEKSGCSLIEILSQYFPGGTERNHGICQSGWLVSMPRFERSMNKPLFHKIQKKKKKSPTELRYRI
jgi:hypothetical protein